MSIPGVQSQTISGYAKLNRASKTVGNFSSRRLPWCSDPIHPIQRYGLSTSNKAKVLQGAVLAVLSSLSSASQRLASTQKRISDLSFPFRHPKTSISTTLSKVHSIFVFCQTEWLVKGTGLCTRLSGLESLLVSTRSRHKDICDFVCFRFCAVGAKMTRHVVVTTPTGPQHSRTNYDSQSNFRLLLL